MFWDQTDVQNRISAELVPLINFLIISQTLKKKGIHLTESDGDLSKITKIVKMMKKNQNRN